MSDKLSQVSKISGKSRHTAKVCGIDGRVERDQWSRHYKTHHPDEEKEPKIEWVKGKALLGTPWCDNWEEIADAKDTDKKIEPINPLPQFGPSFKAANVKKAQSEVGVKPKEMEVYFDDAKMDSIEERKVAVPGFGDLQTIKIQRKRLPTTTQEVLEISAFEDVDPDDSITTVGANPKRMKIQNSNLDVAAKSLSSANLKILANPKKYQTSTDDSKFFAPTPMAPTVYRDQGMRDGEAIQKLKVLEKGTDVVQLKVLELIKLASFFTQSSVSWYIEQNKDKLLKIKDLILMAQDDAEQLSSEEISSVAYASVLFGGSVWVSLPKMFNSLEPSKLEDTLSLLRSQLTAVRFNDNLAQWICAQWKYLEEQTLHLLRYLKEQHHLKDSLIADIATISIMVHIGNDVTKYLTTLEVFSKYQAFRIVLESMKSSAPTWKSEKKLQFEEFVGLVGFLMKNKNQQLILKNEKDLIELPLKQWMGRLATLQETSAICDVESIQYRLNQLCRLVGILPSEKQSMDLTCSPDDRFQRTLNTVSNAPNALQFANAQYAAFGLAHWRRQMWMIPSGQGKSRTLAMVALILLLTSATTRIHLVFDSAHFMKRDKREFADWWQMHGFINNVECHIGLDFETKPGDVILIDEADQVILSNHAKFEKKIKSNRCICVTATPDNENKMGVERETLNKSEFKFINGWPEGTPLPSSSVDASCLQTLALTPGAELIQHISKVLQDYAVLLYCSLVFQQLLKDSNVQFVLIQEGEEIDDNFLRNLDIGSGPDGLHTLIVTSSSFGMRGFDYRSPQKGITLIIAESFEHQRQATQGITRVGRFGDPCGRFILKDVSLVDETKERIYQSVLFQYLNKIQKNKFQFKSKEEHKVQEQLAVTTTATKTTTNTAKSTPAVGKSKKKAKQKNSSSQSTLTMLPQKDKDLSKRQIKLLAGSGAQILIPTVGKKENADEDDDGEERIEITASQLL